MDNITISMEEYKELLIIKGRYEELKENGLFIKRTIKNPYEIPETPLFHNKITCKAECTD